MTADQINTLYNFNACSATDVPQIGDVTPLKECTEVGGSAEFDLSAFTAMVPDAIVAHNGDSIITPRAGKLTLPEGTYTVKLDFTKCSLSVGEITVACPAAPVADTPVDAPAGSNGPVASTPTGSNAPSKKVNSASSVVISFVVIITAALLL